MLLTLTPILSREAGEGASSPLSRVRESASVRV